MEGFRSGTGNQWRVLEFYSGIGGMRYALLETGVDAIVVEAFEITDVANDVYEHNFGHRPHQGNIQTLSAADLDHYKANVWLLSPPCQPYTRQGHQKGSNDARSSSFLRILEVIPQCSLRPLMLFVENVVGFEKSDTHTKMIGMLHENHYETQEFILSPLQFGLPYSRPRYFCLAKLKPLTFLYAHFNNELLHSLEPLRGQEKSFPASGKKESDAFCFDVPENCRPLRDFLELENTRGENAMEHDEAKKHIENPLNEYIVPPSLVERWGNAMDVVFPSSTRCCCFTKSYYRYVKGTGSFLATVAENTNGESFAMPELHLRYFTPREVANIHSFPEDFSFPEHVTLRQRYALLGNSLSVGVVAPLLRYLFTEGANI